MRMFVMIEMDNASFEDFPATEAARILRRAAEKVEKGDSGFKLMDTNGNAVGAQWVEEE
jgi:hypothetical protein